MADFRLSAHSASRLGTDLVGLFVPSVSPRITPSLLPTAIFHGFGVVAAVFIALRNARSVLLTQ